MVWGYEKVIFNPVYDLGEPGHAQNALAVLGRCWLDAAILLQPLQSAWECPSATEGGAQASGGPWPGGLAVAFKMYRIKCIRGLFGGCVSWPATAGR